MSQFVKEVKTEEEFNAIINGDKPVVVDFWATWCGPCRMLAPVMDDIAQNMPEVTFIKVNVDELERLAGTYRIYSIPCLKMIKNGKEVGESVGFKPQELIEEFIRENM